ncbi:uncharacterized protein SEPMUDRAFT_115652 [Sphaerulina musiva SO2202]|uniref:Uncharacterized protein n=1 Tax=Sphaerulina musiva (strain SO2202) TaxID=692275 RepID=M3D8B5_SPHMS|nr:uncharacterized protein SEPMUDRAFT_115652 [Sphaerulina musiva SO2202]EMF14375.1 hypothetical protein SEPMUDRAFT_115652 [Sphaerulina musiva SO2202]
MSAKEDGIAMVIFAAELAELMAEMLGRRGSRLYTTAMEPHAVDSFSGSGSSRGELPLPCPAVPQRRGSSDTSSAQRLQRPVEAGLRVVNPMRATGGEIPRAVVTRPSNY